MKGIRVLLTAGGVVLTAGSAMASATGEFAPINTTLTNVLGVGWWLVMIALTYLAGRSLSEFMGRHWGEGILWSCITVIAAVMNFGVIGPAIDAGQARASTLDDVPAVEWVLEHPYGEEIE